eukprot:CAMPEP_0114112652 /NCGR_PEP_ID=MMETSP0043_2-20121206/2497_1 /TAXON_ID=464988 /ORGANISM="Hemiselmis andersenii, Strain CCMP644" /LENGTH=101 /DNA_ID=CAMNT_0001204757 /DNA_START=58 /DNA_END=363 /DNA_ORIENTATION=+
MFLIDRTSSLQSIIVDGGRRLLATALDDDRSDGPGEEHGGYQYGAPPKQHDAPVLLHNEAAQGSPQTLTQHAVRPPKEALKCGAPTLWCELSGLFYHSNPH